jgi:putative membrane protein
MGEKAKVKETVSLYSKVWQLPSFIGILARIFVMVLLSSFIIAAMKFYLSGVANFFAIFLSYFSLMLSSSFVGTGLLYFIVRNPGSPLDTRRTFGTIFLGIIAWCSLGTIGAMVDALLGSSFLEIRLWFLGLGIAFLLCSFLITGMSDYGHLRNFVGALMIPLVWVVSFLIVDFAHGILPVLPPFWLFALIAILAVDTIVVLYIFNAVSMPFERDLGIDGPGLLRAFGYDYLAENPQPFEELMMEISVTQDLPMEALVIKSGGVLKAVGVVLYIHPGPFRDIGSSGLPATIIKHIRDEFGVQGFVLHGTCTHHQNLASKDEYSRILEVIDTLVENIEVEDEIVGPIKGHSGKFTTWALGSGKNAITITTSAPHFTDDISLEVGRRAADRVRSRFPEIGQVSIIDAHNTIGDDAVSVMPGDPEAEQYADAVVQAVDILLGSSKKPVLMGISQKIPTDLSIKDGMGPGGIIALVMKTDGKKSSFIIVDGNNVHQGFRGRVLDRLEHEGFADSEILTTDTHVVNAVSMSSKGYPSVGVEQADRILDTISEAAREAVEDLEKVQIGFGFDVIEQLHVFGEKGFDTLTMDIAEAASIAKRNGIAAGSFAFLFMLLSSLLM